MIINRSKYTIRISENVLSILEKFKQNKFQNESGGIILGSVYNNIIYIKKVSLPSNFDKSSRNTFDRDKKIAQIIVDFEYYNSKGEIIYLGEWHTHPEKNPLPSYVDTKMIKQQYKENKINEDFLILLIQGTESLYVSLYNGNEIIDS
jgi:integrative and conjugative element protein (TIGR02256 family)